jgi:glycosyltransferase involved in cell wall biosynthesis
MPAFYRAIDIFCLPSFKEGFPLSPLEAQSAGVPVVASDTGGMKETLCPINGHLVVAGNVEQLSETLLKVVTQLCSYTNTNPITDTVRNWVTANNDVRLMASRYHSLSN